MLFEIRAFRISVRALTLVVVVCRCCLSLLFVCLFVCCCLSLLFVVVIVVPLVTILIYFHLLHFHTHLFSLSFASVLHLSLCELCHSDINKAYKQEHFSVRGFSSQATSGFRVDTNTTFLYCRSSSNKVLRYCLAEVYSFVF